MKYGTKDSCNRSQKNIVILIVGRNSICLCGLKPGMTFSIPPQTTALQVQIL